MVEFPDWKGDTALIVATGPSAAAIPLDQAKGRAKVIVIKQWRLMPWADVLYASDGLWWDRQRGLPEFSGLKITASPRAARLYDLTQVSPVGRGGHSGSHAIHLAMDFGARRIVLVGFDLPLLDDHDGALRGIEVINASPTSPLKSFPKMSLAEALGYGVADQDRTDQPRHRIDAERDAVAEGPKRRPRRIRWGANRGRQGDRS